jgi:hypothetical protein
VDDVDGLESADSRLLFVQDVDRASVEGVSSVHGGDGVCGSCDTGGTGECDSHVSSPIPLEWRQH